MEVALPFDWYSTSTTSLSNEIDRLFSESASCRNILLTRSDAPPSEKEINALLDAAGEFESRLGLVSGGYVTHGASGATVSGQYWWSPAELAWKSECRFSRGQRGTLLTPTSTPSLGFCLVGRAAWREVGPLDPELPLSLAGIDFALRGARLGQQSYVCESAQIVTSLRPSAFEEPDLERRIRGALRLARKHGVPTGALTLAARQLACLAANEVAKVDPHANYGREVGSLRRRYWYLTNLARALRREPVRKGAATVALGLAGALGLRGQR